MTNTGYQPADSSTHEQASSLKESVVATRTELEQANIKTAFAAHSSAMIKYGEHIWMLVTCHDDHRTASHDYTSLFYAGKLVTLYPTDHQGYCRSI